MVLARKKGVKVGELAQLVSPYPSLADAIGKTAALYYANLSTSWVGAVETHRRVGAIASWQLASWQLAGRQELSCNLQAASCKLLPASCFLQAASCKVLRSSCFLKLLPASCFLQAASCKLLPASCFLQAASCKLLLIRSPALAVVDAAPFPFKRQRAARRRPHSARSADPGDRAAERDVAVPFGVKGHHAIVWHGGRAHYGRFSSATSAITMSASRSIPSAQGAARISRRLLERAQNDANNPEPWRSAFEDRQSKCSSNGGVAAHCARQAIEKRTRDAGARFPHAEETAIAEGFSIGLYRVPLLLSRGRHRESRSSDPRSTCATASSMHLVKNRLPTPGTQGDAH